MVSTTNLSQWEEAPNDDAPPELQPIFVYLSSHACKLYYEGYFLKLHDLDTRGRPCTDRVWNECFAQLVGLNLSMWDAAALDEPGEEGEVLPTFINLADASIKMVKSLPMNNSSGQTLKNVLMLSTAGINRYLLHFNSPSSLTLWTASIRLAMFEHSCLQEAYTGSLLAGKGRYLNNIQQIMQRTKIKYEDWARVRFGAGTPWQRCWIVITPPHHKDNIRYQKTTKKEGGPYNHSKRQLPTGTIKFYHSKKISKKTVPIVTITDVFSAYAIYPQAKSLIDQSTLVKIEGLITIPAGTEIRADGGVSSVFETRSDGFVFVMPDLHPAVSGFEMMLRFLFPLWDSFRLYGRPNRLIADVRDTRGLMFAMPKEKLYGYLDIYDVSALVNSPNSHKWSEMEWRKALKNSTSDGMLRDMEMSKLSLGVESAVTKPTRTRSHAGLSATMSQSVVQLNNPPLTVHPRMTSVSMGRSY